MVQQPAVAGAIASAEAKKVSQGDLCRGRPRRRRHHDFPFPREYLGVYLERRRESGFQLYNTLGILRGDKMAYARQALENYNFFGAPHVAIIHTDEPLGVYGAIDCGAYVANFMLAAQALGLGTIPQAALARHSGLIRRHFGLGDDRGWYAGFHSVSPTTTTRSTATAPRGRASRIPSPISTEPETKTPHNVERQASARTAAGLTRAPSASKQAAIFSMDCRVIPDQVGDRRRQ